MFRGAGGELGEQERETMMQMSSRQRIEIAADAIFNEIAAMFQADMRRILSERTGVELSEDEYRVAIQKALGAAQNRTATLVGTS